MPSCTVLSFGEREIRTSCDRRHRSLWLNCSPPPPDTERSLIFHILLLLLSPLCTSPPMRALILKKVALLFCVFSSFAPTLSGAAETKEEEKASSVSATRGDGSAIDGYGSSARLHTRKGTFFKNMTNSAPFTRGSPFISSSALARRVLILRLNEEEDKKGRLFSSTAAAEPSAPPPPRQG